MAIGDAAVAAGMEFVSGATPASDIDQLENQTRDYIATLPVLKSIVTPVGNALITAASEQAGRLAIGLNAMSTAAESGTIAQRDAAGNLVMTTGYANGGTGPQPNHLATRGYVDASLRRRDLIIEALIARIEALEAGQQE